MIYERLKGEKRTVTCVELEGGRDRRSIRLDLNAFTDENLIQVFQIKIRDTTFEKGIALGELVFEMFGVATKGESLTMPVLLVAGGSGCCTSGASRVFRIALQR